MSSDGEHFNFDVDSEHQEDRHSPPTLDGFLSPPVDKPPKRPPTLFLPRQGSVDYTRYEQILKRTRKYNTINDLPYHLREEVKDCLNIEKESRTDWRGVASRMHIKTTTIEKIERDFKDDPTKKVFQEISNQKITELLQVLYQMDRQDVLNIFYDICIKDETELTSPGASAKRKEYQSSKYPSQESTPVSGCSSSSDLSYTTPNTPKSPMKYKDAGASDSEQQSDSGVGSTQSQPTERRTKTGSFAKQHTDDNLARDLQKVLSFHSEESKAFWHQIPPKPTASRKEWRQIEEHLKKKFRKESMQSQLMRFICYILKVDPYEERHNKFVHDQDFANLVAWFGPMKTGKDGCFAKIHELITKSINYEGSTGPHSFFAGYMSKDEADRVIGAAQAVGTFLIRFSSTFAESGSFVVVLKTEIGVEHVVLQGNPETGKITYDGKDYDDLIMLWRWGLCRGGVSSNKRVSCSKICPNLPLNAMFKPYGAGPRPPPLGRGRGRGRNQEQ